MNLLTKILLIISLSLSLNASRNSDIKFGFLSEGTLLLSFPDAKIALKSWIEEVAIGKNEKVDVLFSDTSASLYSSLKKNELDMIVVDLPYFFKNKKDILKTSDDFWSLNMGNNKYSQYYLIAKKSLNAKSFKDIKNKTMSFEKGNKGAFIWLDKSSLIENKTPAKKILKKTFVVKNESRAILNIFFNKSDFAVVRKRTWDTATELNPSIAKKMYIVKKSKKINLSFIGFFRKGMNKNQINYFFEFTKDLKSLRNSGNMMDLLKFNNIFKIDDDSLNILTKYYDEYFTLKNKYK